MTTTHTLPERENELSASGGHKPLSRRDFIASAVQTLAGIAIVGSVVPLIQSCANSTSSPSISHGKATISVAQLTTDNSAIISSELKPEGTPVIIVRKSATAYTTISMYCPHEGCTVDAPSNNRIVCTCHNSIFDMSGKLLSGPSPRGLSAYLTTYDPETKTVTVTY